MPRAVLDSSVLISTFLTPRGVTADVLRAADGGAYIPCLSAAILEETASALLRNAKLAAPYRYTPAEVQEFCDDLAASVEMVANLPDLRAVPGDPKDDMVVATAVAAHAEFLVTGDRRHLRSLGSYQGIRIVTPREFLDLLAG
jgi:putative PIN family toxin of toxin-antitoxin system